MIVVAFYSFQSFIKTFKSKNNKKTCSLLYSVTKRAVEECCKWMCGRLATSASYGDEGGVRLHEHPRGRWSEEGGYMTILRGPGRSDEGGYMSILGG